MCIVRMLSRKTCFFRVSIEQLLKAKITELVYFENFFCLFFIIVLAVNKLIADETQNIFI